MGTGKSSVGQLLAKKLAIKHVDLDELIQKSTQKSISDLFKDEGEIYFRKIESEILRTTLDQNIAMVISLGGGTPCYANNHELLKAEGVSSVFLKTSVDVLVERLQHKKQNRPFIAHLTDEQLKEYINKHLFDRSYYYYQSKHIVTTDYKSKEAIALEILNLLGLTV